MCSGLARRPLKAVARVRIPSGLLLNCVSAGKCTQSTFLPNIGVLITGDALVTAHPTFNGVGPRLLPADFSHDQHSAINALKAIRELDAEMFVPGHGPAWYGPISDSVDQALDQATHKRRRSVIDGTAQSAGSPRCSVSSDECAAPTRSGHRGPGSRQGVEQFGLRLLRHSHESPRAGLRPELDNGPRLVWDGEPIGRCGLAHRKA